MSFCVAAASNAAASAANAAVSRVSGGENRQIARLTRRNVVVAIQRNILLDLDLVDTLQYR